MLVAYLALAVFPLIIYSSGIGGMERGEQVNIPQRQRNNVFFTLLFFGNLYFGPFPALPSTLHVCI